MSYAKIIATGSYLPEQILTNADLEKIVDTTDDWIMQRVGVRERHIVGDSGDTVSHMATEAARNALETAGLSPNDIDMVVVGTTTADYFFPSIACIVQERLGINNDCPAFDVNAACAGFIYTLSIAEQFIRGGGVRHALVIGVDALTKMVDWTDRATCVLFGDGAGAAIISRSDEPGIIATLLRAAGRYGDTLYARSTLWNDTSEKPVLNMKGNAVFKIAVNKLNEIVDQTLEKSGYSKSDIDWLIPHQANLRIIQAAAKKLDLPMERVILRVAEHGNTSAASIPLALDYGIREGKIKSGEVLLLEAFGAGLAWGAALVKY